MSAPSGSGIEGLERAWGWVDHLIAGGTTPWSEFTGSAPSRGDVLPGAIQLEVARQLNLVASGGPGTGPGVQPRLISRVLETGAPGRGQPDLQLTGLQAISTFGPRPVDPGSLPDGELLRMAVGLLAELVAERDPGPLTPSGRGARPWRRAYDLYGDPLTVAHTRRALVEAGHASGRRSPIAVILADDVGTMLADVWQSRVRHAAATPWRRWVAGFARRDALPHPLDLPARAADQASRLGVRRVHVVAAANPVDEVADLLGVRDLQVPARNSLSAEAVEVVRHVNLVLRVLTPEDLHRRLLDRVLVPLLSPETGAGHDVPQRHEAWLRHRAERMREELHSAGYAVHGDLETLIPSDRHHRSDPEETGVLQVALRTLLRVREIES